MIGKLGVYTMSELNQLKDMTEMECHKIQLELMEKIVIYKGLALDEIRYVGGIDLAYWKEGEIEKAVCCIVVIDYNTCEVIENVHVVGEIVFPYIPGCLAFRELPLILEAANKIKRYPDLFIFDGNGYLHPKHMGIATHASLYLNRPTIGVAKSYYKIEGMDFIMPENSEGAYTDIVINNEVYGRALRTHKNVKPIFLSVGNYIDLEMSMKVVNNLITKAL